MKNHLGFLVFTVCCLWAGSLLAQTINSEFVTDNVDILLLQDESGSMDDTDRPKLRQLAAGRIADTQYLAPSGNRVGLMIFSTDVTKTVALGRDFESIRKVAREGLEDADWSGNYKTIANTPKRKYTDIYGALSAAYKHLEQAGGDNRKAVILLTDGDIHSWPGHSRFGESATKFILNVGAQSNPSAYAERYRKEENAEVDKRLLFDMRGLLAKYREKGWKIYCIGLSRSVKKELMQNIAGATGGESDIADDYTKLYRTLKDILPASQQIIKMLEVNFCTRTPAADQAITVRSDIEALQFHIDLSEMAARSNQIRVLKKDFTVTITDPYGKEISSQNDAGFIFHSRANGSVLTVTYNREPSISGAWQINVTGRQGICGKIEVRGRRDHYPQIKLIPDVEKYEWREVVRVIPQLVNSNGQHKPITSVEGKLVRIVNGIIDETKLVFSTADGENPIQAQFVIPEDYNGMAEIRVEMIDPDYPESRIKALRKIEIVPAQPIELSVEVPGETIPKIDLGLIGDKTLSRNSPQVRVFSLNSGRRVPIRVLVPEMTHETGDATLPVTFFIVEPAQGEITPEGGAFTFKMKVEVPEHVPDQYPDGRYEGQLSISSPLSIEDVNIPVFLELKAPRLFIRSSNPTGKGAEDLKFDFGWRLCTSQTGTLTMASSSVRSRKVTITLPANLKDDADHPVDTITVGFANSSEPELIRTIPKKGEIDIPLVVELVETRLDDEVRIEPGEYRGLLYIQGVGLGVTEYELVVTVPETPAIIYARLIASVLAGITLLVLALMIVRYLGSKSKVLAGTDRTCRYDEPGVDRIIVKKSEGGLGAPIEAYLPLPQNTVIRSVKTKTGTQSPPIGERIPNAAQGVTGIWLDNRTEITTPQRKIKLFRYRKTNYEVRIIDSKDGSASGYRNPVTFSAVLFALLSALAIYWWMVC